MKRPRGKWKDSHIVLLVLPIVLTILLPGGGIFYLCGRFSPGPISLVHVCMLYPVVFVFMFWCFFAGIVRLSGRKGKRARKEKLLIAVETGVPLVFVTLFVGSFFLPEAQFFGHGYRFFVYGFRDRVERRADIESTRAWLKSLGAEDYEDGNRISSDELPESLRGLREARATLSADENGNARIRLRWGSAMMGHWGVEIGMKDMNIPPSDFSPYGEYRLPVEPGVYVWWRFE